MKGHFKLNGIGIFGKECYKVPYLPQVFNNSNIIPSFTAQQQQELLKLMNQSFINEETCQTGSIFMSVNPESYVENSFTGKLKLQNLRQFYNIFFAQIAYKLSQISPQNVIDQPIINSQVEIEYISGEIKVNNDVTLIGAFKFKGLIDYHGVIGSLEIIMDPND